MNQRTHQVVLGYTKPSIMIITNDILRVSEYAQVMVFANMFPFIKIRLIGDDMR